MRGSQHLAHLFYLPRHPLLYLTLTQHFSE